MSPTIGSAAAHGAHSSAIRPAGARLEATLLSVSRRAHIESLRRPDFRRLGWPWRQGSATRLRHAGSPTDDASSGVISSSADRAGGWSLQRRRPGPGQPVRFPVVLCRHRPVNSYGFSSASTKSASQHDAISPYSMLIRSFNALRPVRDWMFNDKIHASPRPADAHRGC